MLNYQKRSSFRILLVVNTWRRWIPADNTRYKLTYITTGCPQSLTYVIPQILWTVLPRGWKTLNLELNSIGINEHREPSIISQLYEIKRKTGDCSRNRCHACLECDVAGSNANAASQSSIDIMKETSTLSNPDIYSKCFVETGTKFLSSSYLKLHLLIFLANPVSARIFLGLLSKKLYVQILNQFATA